MLERAALLMPVSTGAERAIQGTARPAAPWHMQSQSERGRSSTRKAASKRSTLGGSAPIWRLSASSTRPFQDDDVDALLRTSEERAAVARGVAAARTGAGRNLANLRGV